MLRLIQNLIRMEWPMRLLGPMLGLLTDTPEAFHERVKDAWLPRLGLTREEIAERLTARCAARGRRDFAAADAIRDELAARGIVLEDGPEGTRWKKV